MTRIAKLYARALAGGTLTFKEEQRLVEAFHFELKRTSGSHHIYRHSHLPLILNLQPQGKDAKAYQVQQFLDIIEEHGLEADES